jgi:hypothetical protein
MRRGDGRKVSADRLPPAVSRGNVVLFCKPRKSCRFARTSWWSGGDSNRWPSGRGEISGTEMIRSRSMIRDDQVRRVAPSDDGFELASGRRPGIEVSATAARHSFVTSSITSRIRMHRPSQSWSWTKSTDQCAFGRGSGGHLAIRAGCVFRDNLAEHVALNEDKTADVGRETLRIPILRTFSVFHASQVDGIAALASSATAKTVPERIEDAKTILLHPEGRFRPRPSGSVPGLTARQCLQSQLQPYHPPSSRVAACAPDPPRKACR